MTHRSTLSSASVLAVMLAASLPAMAAGDPSQDLTTSPSASTAVGTSAGAGDYGAIVLANAEEARKRALAGALPKSNHCPGLGPCNIPASDCSLGDLIVPATTQGFPTVADINTDTGQVTIAAFTSGQPFIVFTETRIDTGVTNGIFNFNSVTVEAGAQLVVTGTVPLVLLACGDVVIDGDILIDGRPGMNGGGGPGGDNGNPHGPPESGGDARSGQGDGGASGYHTGEDGSGPSPGSGSEYAQSGGGGGGAGTAGAPGGFGAPCTPDNGVQIPTPAAGGPAIDCGNIEINLFGGPDTPKLYLPSGSGGGGGSGDGALYGDDGGDEGGGGGAGGGSLSVCAAGTILVNGTVSNDGAKGGDSNGACSSAGGGGSGGNVLFIAETITGSGLVRALGAPGGVASAPGGEGGDGHVLFQAADLGAPPMTDPPFTEIDSCSREPVPPPPSTICCRTESQPPFECAGAVTQVVLSGAGSSPDGPVIAQWSGPCPIADASAFDTTADCAGTGSFTFTLTVTLDEDGDGTADPDEDASACGLTVTVQDTTAPVPSVPDTITVDCEDAGGADVALTASATDGCGGVGISNSRTGASDDASGHYPVGETVVAWEFVDEAGNKECRTTRVTVTAVDPTITVLVPSACLWSPNHKYVAFNLADFVAVEGGCSGGLDVTCTSSEADEDGADGRTEGDCLVVAASTLDVPRELLVRSERQGSGGGRTYTVTVTSGASAGVFTITVPHDNPGDDCVAPAPAHLID